MEGGSSRLGAKVEGLLKLPVEDAEFVSAVHRLDTFFDPAVSWSSRRCLIPKTRAKKGNTHTHRERGQR